MDNKKTSQGLASQSANAPLTIFADQPAAIQVGPYVTKFTLGVIDGEDEYPRPVVTIAMPTVNLMRMVEDMQALFIDQEFKKDTMKMLSDDAKIFFNTQSQVKKDHQLDFKKVTKRVSKK